MECPTCHAKVAYADKAEVPFRPFCSRRCQWMDLGKWLNEDFRVTEEIPPELLDIDEDPRKTPPEFD